MLNQNNNKNYDKTDEIIITDVILEYQLFFLIIFMIKQILYQNINNIYDKTDVILEYQ